MKTKLYLIFLAIAIFSSCKKKDTEPKYKTSVKVNGSSIHTDATAPTTSGFYTTLYYNETTGSVSFNLKDATSGDNIVVVFKTMTNMSNASVTFDGLNNYGYYYPFGIYGQNHKTTGSITINSLILNNNHIENFDATFSFTHTFKDLDGKEYTYKVENGIIRNLKETL